MPALPVRQLAPISESVAILPPTHLINVAVNHPLSCRQRRVPDLALNGSPHLVVPIGQSGAGCVDGSTLAWHS